MIFMFITEISSEEENADDDLDDNDTDLLNELGKYLLNKLVYHKNLRHFMFLFVLKHYKTLP